MIEREDIRRLPRDYPAVPKHASRVVLVGFMAAGKSTVGRRLAALLDWDFIDFDDEIERRTGLAIPEFFRRHGEPEFRALEAELTRELADADAIVMAPGGGWITQPELLEMLSPDTLVVWLDISPEEAVRRAGKTLSHRPLLAGADDPIATARDMIGERGPLYALADVALGVDGREADEIARELAALLTD